MCVDVGGARARARADARAHALVDAQDAGAPGRSCGRGRARVEPTRARGRAATGDDPATYTGDACLYKHRYAAAARVSAGSSSAVVTIFAAISARLASAASCAASEIVAVASDTRMIS